MPTSFAPVSYHKGESRRRPCVSAVTSLRLDTGGLRTERAAVEAAGISWRTYEGFMKKHEKAIEEETLQRVPRDLDLTPYRDLKDFQLLQALVTRERRPDSKPRRARGP